jgi:hypothetical protein
VFSRAGADCFFAHRASDVVTNCTRVGPDSVRAITPALQLRAELAGNKADAVNIEDHYIGLQLR